MTDSEAIDLFRDQYARRAELHAKWKESLVPGFGCVYAGAGFVECGGELRPDPYPEFEGYKFCSYPCCENHLDDVWELYRQQMDDYYGGLL